MSGSRSFAFIFPMASGHINPSLALARRLVEQGHEVHYLCREQMREAIEDTGAMLHLETALLHELYDGREPDLFGANESLKKELGIDQNAGMLEAFGKLNQVTLELQLPGVLRWLRQVRPSAILYCPMMNREAAQAGKVLGIPSIALLTTAGPGSLEHAMKEFMWQEGTSSEQLKRMVEGFEPNQAAVARMNATYGLDLKLCAGCACEPVGKLDVLKLSAVTLVTTCGDLQDPMGPALTEAYAAEGVAFDAVGPLLDQAGAKRAGGHKFEAGVSHAASEEGEVIADLMSRLRAARTAGRRVVMVSMGTVVTGDNNRLGWSGRMIGAGGEPRGLTGRELCHGAWGGAFDAFGAASAEEGPLILISLGPQPDALGELKAPPNAVCLPYLPQVDVLKAGVDVFLTHGGQNSFTEALDSATPVVVCPGFGDQVVNSHKAVNLGVGLKVDRPDPDAGYEAAAVAAYRAQVASALLAVASEPRFGVAAGSCAERLHHAGGVTRAAEIVLRISEAGATRATKAVEESPAKRAKTAPLAGA